MTALAPPPRVRPPLVPRVRVLRVVWRLLPHLGLCVVAAAAAWALGASEAVKGQVLVGCAFVLSWSLLRAVAMDLLSPMRPGLRLLPLPDARAVQLAAATEATLAVVAASEFLSWLLAANGGGASLPAVLRIARNGALVVFVAVAIASSGVLGRLRSKSRAGALDLIALLVAGVLFPLAVPAALALVVTHGLGYEPLAEWILSSLAWTAGQVVVAAVAMHTLSRALRRALSLGRASGPDGPAEPSPAAVGAERLGVGAIRLGIALAAAVWILSTWGLHPSRVASLLAEPVLGLGWLTWGRMLGGAAKVAVVLLVWRLLRTLLVFFVFPRASVDVGARYAVLTVLRYAVVALAILFGLDAVGVETGSLAWFFGAAGIGIGLGLQDVIANFFAGLVMLLERPVRVGDIVEVGTLAGTVEAVRMRGTVIRTGQGTTVVVPNRQMLSERLTNLTYDVAHGLVDVRVAVAHGTEPVRVERALLSAARAHPDVLLDPAPVVRFSEFEPSALVFVLYCRTGRVRDRGGVASELRARILRVFGEAGIRMPFPQQDVHVRTMPPPRA